MTTPIYRLLPAMAAWWVVSRVSCAGFDEYMTCGTGSERYGRHSRYHPNLPCDLSKESYCESAGTQYPWGAVRRFVYENQGLMKRMYGNQRHYNVLRAEIVNEMYEEMFEEMPSRHHYKYHPQAAASASSTSNSRTARYQKNTNTNSLKTKSWTKSSKENGRQGSRAMKVTAEPEYHPHQKGNRASSTTTTTPRPKTKTKPSEHRLKVTPQAASEEAKDSSEATDAPNSKTTRINTRRPQSGNTNPSTTAMGENAANTAGNILWSSDTDDHAPDTHRPTNGDWSFLEKEHREEQREEQRVEQREEQREEQSEHVNIEPTYFPPLHHLFGEEDDEIWTTLEDLDIDAFSTPTSDPADVESTYSTIPQQEVFTATPTTAEPDALDDFLGTEENFDLKDITSTPPDKDVSTTVADLSDRLRDDGVEADTESYDQDIEEVMEEDAEEITLEEEENLEVEMREEVPTRNGEVHKDVLEDVEKHDTPSEPIRIKRPIRGVNACPVKEEFVAPYWANNTRGETLALLNLYPFEQYVQWERCMHEHRQMYCRKGCRCEQQYRLHKLLAFDPTNECRGIFSDWFRFPSCCVCKCYDLPPDIFTTSTRRGRLQNEDDDEYDDNDSDKDDDDLDNQDDDDDDDKEDNLPGDDDEVNAGYIQQVRVRSGGGRLANIPPQRRPRKPPRPYSHISSPSLRPPPPPPPPPTPPSHLLPPPSSTPSPDVTSTLGTVDKATPHYYHNISSHARLLFANSQPFPLSRIPRNVPEV